MTNKPRYGVDTVALLAYFVNKLGTRADQIFREGEKLEAELIVPGIVIGEAIYTIRKGREIFGQKIPRDLQEAIINTLFQSAMYKITSMNLKGWKLFLKSSISELHDRMIVSTCIQEQVTDLITTDSELDRISEIK